MNKIPHRFNLETKMAGKHWTLSLRNPEKISLARAIGFNKVQCQRFFDNLKTIYEKTKASGHRIFNMDETGLSTVPNKSHKIYAFKGKRTVSKIVSAERGQLTTAVVCMSAGGVWAPPGLIFARKRMKEELFYGAPPGTLKLISDSGYMNTELFITWLKHFRDFVKPTETDPAILILDNYISHCSLEAIMYARENFIVLLTLPPHSSHKMQPLDRCFFFPLKSAFSVECDKWMISNQGRPITVKEISALFHAAYAKVATLQIAEKSFACTGIYPYNPDIYTEADFAPAEVTDKPATEVEPVQNVQPENEFEQTEAETVQNVQPEIMFEQSDSDDEEDLVPLATLKTKYLPERHEDRTPTQSPDLSENVQNVIGRIGNFSSNPVSDKNSIYYNPGPSCSHSDPGLSYSKVTPKMIIPLPKAKHQQIRRQRSKKSEILSSTPYKDEVTAEQEENIKKQGGKRNVFSSQKTQLSKKKKLLLSQKKLQREDNTICPGCNGHFSSSDWIQCINCGNWWHEDCTSYEGINDFVCDFCEV